MLPAKPYNNTDYQHKHRKNNHQSPYSYICLRTRHAVRCVCQILWYNRYTSALASQLPEYPVVMEMYGVGESLGPQLMAEIGDVRRFERKQSLVAFAGIDPAPSESGDYCSRSNRTTKRGSPYLRKTLFNIMKVHLQRAPADEPVFQFLDKKRAEGKPYYVYMTAAGNKFLRRYYGKVMAYFSTLEGLPPVDMDSTGLHHAE